ELREFSAPTRAALDGIVVEDLADDVDVLAVVDLEPDRLQHLSKQRTLAVVAVHEAADVRQAHVAALELRMGQHTDATGARIRVAIEREVHLLHAVALGSGTECRLGALRGATEENAIFLVELHRHGSVSSDCD